LIIPDGKNTIKKTFITAENSKIQGIDGKSQNIYDLD